MHVAAQIAPCSRCTGGQANDQVAAHIGWGVGVTGYRRPSGLWALPYVTAMTPPGGLPVTSHPGRGLPRGCAGAS